MGSRHRSPGAYPADGWGPQAGGPGPAKRRRTEEPAGPESESESESEAAPSLDNVPEPPAESALTSVLVLPSGCALHLLLDHVDWLLEPEPASVLQVTLGDHILLVVHEALLGSGVEGPWGQGQERGSFLGARGRYMALEPGVFCTAVLEVACQEDVSEEEEEEEETDFEFLPPGMDAAAGSVAGLRSPDARVWGPDAQGFVPEPWPWAPNPSLERGSPQHEEKLDLHLPQPFGDSPLHPLPPSPCPVPHEQPQRPHGPSCKARRCLILE
ncbi:proline-rich protein 23C-like [Hippopotamus amphibius kiboko]|uniref:proline-rich protein 23C-like n=1 Tax=Hippopotamus amphibius kiboko TaxID=575201 RepID=UPI00259AB889|nr:proline-rich protein 23C-like [Hippopotamus amphibius kiboko]